MFCCIVLSNFFSLLLAFFFCELFIKNIQRCAFFCCSHWVIITCFKLMKLITCGEVFIYDDSVQESVLLTVT